MRINFARRFAKSNTIDDAGMIQFVADNHIAFLHQRRDHTQVGGIAGLEGERGLCMLKTCQLLFQLIVHRHSACDSTNLAGTNAIALNSLNGKLF